MAEVKVDKELLERIKKLIKKGDNRFDFPTVKSFVDTVWHQVEYFGAQGVDLVIQWRQINRTASQSFFACFAVIA